MSTGVKGSQHLRTAGLWAGEQLSDRACSQNVQGPCFSLQHKKKKGNEIKEREREREGSEGMMGEQGKMNLPTGPLIRAEGVSVCFT